MKSNLKYILLEHTGILSGSLGFSAGYSYQYKGCMVNHKGGSTFVQHNNTIGLYSPRNRSYTNPTQSSIEPLTKETYTCNNGVLSNNNSSYNHLIVANMTTSVPFGLANSCNYNSANFSPIIIANGSQRPLATSILSCNGQSVAVCTNGVITNSCVGGQGQGGGGGGTGALIDFTISNPTWNTTTKKRSANLCTTKAYNGMLYYTYLDTGIGETYNEGFSINTSAANLCQSVSRFAFIRDIVISNGGTPNQSLYVPGPYTYGSKITLDFQNAIAESNETNNTVNLGNFTY